MQLGAIPVSGTTGPGNERSISDASPTSPVSTWTFEVTERDIRRFRQAIGEPVAPQLALASLDGAPADGEASALTAPPLFFQAMAWQDVSPELLPPDGAPLETLGGPPEAFSMGGASDFTVQRPVCSGERIVVRSRLLGVQMRQGRHGPLCMVSRETWFTDAQGCEVARERATYLRRAL